jgi:hypothetical protein
MHGLCLVNFGLVVIWGYVSGGFIAWVGERTMSLCRKLTMGIVHQVTRRVSVHLLPSQR